LSLKLIRLLIAQSETRYMNYECRTQPILTGCTECLSRLLSRQLCRTGSLYPPRHPATAAVFSEGHCVKWIKRRLEVLNSKNLEFSLANVVGWVRRSLKDNIKGDWKAVIEEMAIGLKCLVAGTRAPIAVYKIHIRNSFNCFSCRQQFSSWLQFHTGLHITACQVTFGAVETEQYSME